MAKAENYRAKKVMRISEPFTLPVQTQQPIATSDPIMSAIATATATATTATTTTVTTTTSSVSTAPVSERMVATTNILQRRKLRATRKESIEQREERQRPRIDITSTPEGSSCPVTSNLTAASSAAISEAVVSTAPMETPEAAIEGIFATSKMPPVRYIGDIEEQQRLNLQLRQQQQIIEHQYRQQQQMMLQFNLLQQNAARVSNPDTATTATATKEPEKMEIADRCPNYEEKSSRIAITSSIRRPPGIPPLTGDAATRSALLRPFLTPSTSERGTAEDGVPKYKIHLRRPAFHHSEYHRRRSTNGSDAAQRRVIHWLGRAGLQYAS
ncbi:hypothetical protein U1Q18_050701 [Sarracenia purpurea var. burkii]